MTENKPAVCILAAGKGERLGRLSDDFHKALLPMGDRAVLSYSIDKFPKDLDIVMAVGHKSELIIQYCKAMYPERNFTFVQVDDVESDKSGPGLSMWMCREHLQRPFYLTTCDCIVMDSVPDLSKTWIGLSEIEDPRLFSTACTDQDGKVLDFVNKSENGYIHAYIGMAGIADYEQFWKNLFDHQDDHVSWENVVGFYDFNGLYGVHLDWYDTGTEENYLQTKKTLVKTTHNLEKHIDDITYFNNNRVVKMFKDSRKCHMRTIRGEQLSSKGVSPQMSYVGENVYAYRRLNAHNLYQNFTIEKFDKFLKWYDANFVYTKKTVKVDLETHKSHCRNFYQNKTYKRVKQFLDSKPEHYYLKHNINNRECYSISELLLLLDWDKLCDGTPIDFHGDLNFGNVLYDGRDFWAIDWREDFGNGMSVGDLYYDLAKLYAGLCLSWDALKDDSKINMTIQNRSVTYNLDRIGLLADTRKRLVDWCKLNRYDVNKIKILANITYLNMAPLHTEKLGDLLFFKAVHNLSELV